jgi:hypothetical protein
VVQPLGKDPTIETYESTADGLSSLVERLKDIVKGDSDTFVYIIQGARWHITQGPQRHLVNGSTKVPLFDTDEPEIQEDGFLGKYVEPTLDDLDYRTPETAEALVNEEQDFTEDEFFENEPDYDESLDAEEV